MIRPPGAARFASYAPACILYQTVVRPVLTWS
jgi:hypothetical protein